MVFNSTPSAAKSCSGLLPALAPSHSEQHADPAFIPQILRIGSPAIRQLAKRKASQTLCLL
jgi:hypothetical protein